ncbi:hypothetical protein EV368DRAFT_69506 [Lentinula lateritia]|uniref:Uncharacterized protein n=1 Tax=Lentinula aff. lateritia TaxID=2804960 RepID=A0ACC1TJ40_9AGAR|nr:hypothetical protein F5876DRAFT_70341 [Lentinula aff. lateritia]KAJ3846939.1 hypothetical protein EV368DRAFT_69506 [Lentinula lateritia]
MFRTLSLPLLAILVLVSTFHMVFSMPVTLNATSKQPAQRLANNVKYRGLYLMIKRIGSEDTKHGYSTHSADEDWLLYVGNFQAFHSVVGKEGLIPQRLNGPPSFNTAHINTPSYLKVYANFENPDAMASAFDTMCRNIRGFDTNLQFIDRAIGYLVKELKVIYEYDNGVEKQVTELPEKWIALYNTMKPIGPAGAKVDTPTKL